MTSYLKFTLEVFWHNTSIRAQLSSLPPLIVEHKQPERRQQYLEQCGRKKEKHGKPERSLFPLLPGRTDLLKSRCQISSEHSLPGITKKKKKGIVARLLSHFWHDLIHVPAMFNGMRHYR